MRRAMIDPVRCRNCSPCAVIDGCSMGAAFREADRDKPWIDFYRCSGCMRCKTACPAGAVLEISQPCGGKPRMGW